MAREFIVHKPRAAKPSGATPLKGGACGPARATGPGRPAVAGAGGGPDEAAPPKEIGGPSGPEPTRYGDWERNGICYDF